MVVMAKLYYCSCNIYNYFCCQIFHSLLSPEQNNAPGLLCVLVFLAMAQLFFSCGLTRHVPEDEYLLTRMRVRTDSREIDRSEVRGYLRQEPNNRIVGVPFNLMLYNMSNPEKDGWPHDWLRRIGEEPVIFDRFETGRAVRQIEQYLRNKGFYNAEVDDSVRFRRQRARVTYSIEANEPLRLNDISYDFEDKALEDIVLEDTANSLLQSGDIFDVDLLQEERNRIERYLRNLGYYNFNREFIYFEADTTVGQNLADLTVGITKYPERLENNTYEQVSHKRYHTGKIFIYTDYNPREALSMQDEYYTGFDTTLYRDMYFLHKGELKINPRIIAQSMFIFPGELYSRNDVDETYRHLFSLRYFRLINIRFREAENNSTNDEHLLDCYLQLTPFATQSYTVELEGTNSSGDFGFGGNLMYQHRNFFGGAEILNLKLKGSIESLHGYEGTSLDNTYEYGIEANMQFPGFLPHIGSVSITRRYNPRTNFTAAYNYQQRPDYTRTIANLGFSYEWQGSEYTTHILTPAQFNFVKLPSSTPEFDSLITLYNLQSSFRDHLVSETSYGFIFNNQDLRRRRDFVYFRANLETGGNLFSAFAGLSEMEKQNGSYHILGNPFAQFIRSDVDFRYYKKLNHNNTLVGRFFAGAGVPYGNSDALPFEKKYFSGGANSIRAWQVRSLGPGSFHDPIDRTFPNRTADVKLEANLEYRFDMFWVLEGALFLDAGNIWAINKSDGREGALFRFDRFYDEIAVGTGFGLRFDFSFFLLRIDTGLKMRDPRDPPGERWIHANRGFDFPGDFTINIGIGYPF